MFWLCVRYIVFVFYHELFPGPVSLAKLGFDLLIVLIAMTTKIPRWVLPHFWSEIGSTVRIWKAEQHTSLRIPGNRPRIAQLIIDSLQGCAQRKIEGSPVLWTCKIQCAQHMISMKKLRFSSRREQKLGAEGHRTLLEHSLGLHSVKQKSRYVLPYIF